jgi:hypothetical protein
MSLHVKPESQAEGIGVLNLSPSVQPTGCSGQRALGSCGIAMNSRGAEGAGRGVQWGSG